MIRIGVLALQGAVNEHVNALRAADVETVIVKKAEQLNDIDGLVFPGGESTTMRRLIDKYAFFEPLKQFAAAGKPIFGTCAGAILMAGDLAGEEQAHLGVMNITVERNAFGRQRESFEVALDISSVGESVEAVFIRAPIIQKAGPNVRVLAEYDGQIVACQEGPFLACSFHPELTEDNRLHQYFVQMIRELKISA
ncbi:pyridoxal 5'-phosphate synthase glutaminase subunit PdxT [Salisediminibacterium halotolerans]|uniref:pyridoxal 5'-phosphate synthase glutaminase subunit PdxT n=1 Tax=Salisediminibacterium halotolerans TaxID=517425 RepID=UPI000EB4C3CE|nr:pyridoxal 5'-phosphate synthase glutaminase subunit PdxT [Salisediminibacterium halotolerans]RLJ79341.1 pyridoxal phosphate synthase yaaE subunit [Actinophytocola xinjiangensis]RPE83409.1 pyridoxal phosphate synthase yaaE subunit [Salisediminibacterium halotolerans]TWG37783.1 pyridoxal phosphate synthase yaaE subunit [Salisediminibacterium halotolerans]GEL08508.1 pyridoxal 5'-phosphate synthase subunit PdxT [Salisediminibacterium halotolerans]